MALSEQELIRREKLERLRAMGINPYPAAAYTVTPQLSERKIAIQRKPASRGRRKVDV